MAKLLSESEFQHMRLTYGNCAFDTYIWLSQQGYRHDYCELQMKRQAKLLGTEREFGVECTPFRFTKPESQNLDGGGPWPKWLPGFDGMSRNGFGRCTVKSTVPIVGKSSGDWREVDRLQRLHCYMAAFGYFYNSKELNNCFVHYVREVA